MYGDKQGDKFVWSISVLDSRGHYAVTDGVDNSEKDAKACMLTKNRRLTITQLVDTG